MPDKSGAFMLGAREALGDPETLPAVPEDVEKPTFVAFAVIILADGETVSVDLRDLDKYDLIQATAAQVAAGCHAVGQNILIGTLTNSVIMAQQAMVRQAVEQDKAQKALAQLGDLTDPNIPIVGRPHRSQ